MASSIAVPLTNVILGLANISTGIGFTVEEKKKVGELKAKSAALEATVIDAGNMYDRIYYPVAVNLARIKKALDKLPSEFLEKVQAQVTSGITEDNVKKALQTASVVLGYTKTGQNVVSNITTIVIVLRERKASGEEPPESTDDAFEMVPLGDEEPVPEPEPEPLVPTEDNSSFSNSPKLNKFAKGLEIGGIVFGIAGLVVTIGLKVWTLEKLNDAISDVEKKQKQVDAFRKAMTDALDSLVKDAALPEKSYDRVTKMASTWKKISENFDSYEKSLYYAIRGYFQKKSLDDIKAMVSKESDAGKPFPDDGYPLAKALANDIKYLFSQKKSDREVITFFATENPKIGLRFVFQKYFIGSLRSH